MWQIFAVLHGWIVSLGGCWQELLQIRRAGGEQRSALDALSFSVCVDGKLRWQGVGANVVCFWVDIGFDFLDEAAHFPGAALKVKNRVLDPGLPQLPTCRYPTENVVHDHALTKLLFTESDFV